MTTAPGPSALRLFTILIISTLLFSCGGNSAQDNSGAGIAFRLKWPVAKSVGLVPSGVDTIRMSVSGPNMATISKDFPASDGAGSITGVPVGGGRAITFQGFSGPAIIYQAIVPDVTLVGGVTFNCGVVTMTPVANPSTLTIPTAPSGLGGTVVSSTQINLLWVDNANNETGFKIERKTGADGAYAEIATVTANDTIYSDTSLSDSTTYYYRVRATTSGVGDSGYSNEFSAVTSAVAPASSYSISGTVTSGGAALAGATVTRSGNGTTTTTTDSAGNYSFSGVQNGSYTLTPGKSGYTFAPATMAATVEDANLSAMNFTAAAVSTVPTAPSGLVATAVSSSLVNLSWTDNASNETGFRIYRKTGSGGACGDGVPINVAANVSTYNDITVSDSTTYYYQVLGTNAVGDSLCSGEASITTPAPTYSISGTITSGGGAALAGVTVTRSGNGSTTTDSGGNYSFSVQSGDYTLTPSKTDYTFSPTILAVTVNGANQSAMNFVATPVPIIPAVPSGLVATAVSSNQIKLAWIDNANNETGYKIERAESGGTFTQIATVAANSRSYNDTPLSVSTTYLYRVRATSSFGDSGYTAEVSDTTFAAPISIDPVLVNVPGGISTFGGVTVGAFLIGKYEVTQREWSKVMGYNHSIFNTCGLDCPVENVSWIEIQNFISTLNGLSGISYRLPTEAEWQYAAQSGGNGKEVYSGGIDVNAVAWYSGNSGGITHLVGSDKPGSTLSGSNGLGIYDMSGNVSEWVNDFFGTSTTNHVIRGGSAFVDASSVTTTIRGSSNSGFRDKFLGFRLAVSTQ